MRTFITAAAALFVVTGTPALSQGQELTEDQVRSFLKDATSQAEQSVNAGDWQSLQEWRRNNVSDDAQFAMKGAIVGAKTGTFTYAGTLSGRQLDQLASSGMMGPRGFIQALKDYSLETEIQSVSILPNGEATALVHFQESGRIDPAQLAQGEDSESSAQEGRSATADEQEADQDEMAIHAASRCDMRLRSAGQDKIEIIVAACDTTTTF